jgi:hypothetical protein
MANKKKNIDPKLVENLAAIHSTDKEIAMVCGCSEGHLRTVMRDALDAGRLRASMSVKKMLFRSAQTGKVAAQIFLAKTVCGMKETKIIETNPEKSGVEALTDEELDLELESLGATPEEEPEAEGQEEAATTDTSQKTASKIIPEKVKA